MIPGFMIQGGDTDMMDGRGGKCMVRNASVEKGTERVPV